MSRYPRLLLGLAVLALAYWGLGGFQEFVLDTEYQPPANPETGINASVDTNAIGGPDDGPHLGLAPLGDPDGNNPAILERVSDWRDVTIGRNESFYVALQRNGLPHETIMAVVAACKDKVNLRKVRRGDTFHLAFDGAELEAVRFDIDNEQFVIVQNGPDGMQSTVANYPVERVVKAARGEIETNLFDALLHNGADPALADQLAEILGWNIDFFRDLRVGDTFEVLYAEYRREDRSVRDPEVLAVHFVNKGKEHRAYRFENDFGLPAYYDESGGSLERQFLRAPLKFTRISSGFTHRRLHPVLKRYRPHYGVDYAAPKGTRVFATSDGTVVDRTRDNASGNFVSIRHGNGYQSFYLHLSRFAKGLHPGQKVAQGEVIGYVGETGWATAPHLDYRIKKNGKWVNPRKLDLPPAKPVADDLREAYAAVVTSDDQLLDAVPASAQVFVLDRAPANPIAAESVTR